MENITAKQERLVQEKIEQEVKKAEYERRVEQAQAAVLKAKNKRNDAEVAYKLAHGGNIASHVLFFVGILMLATPILTGAAGFLACLGIGLGASSAVANKVYFTSDEAKKKAAALRDAEKDYKEAVDQLHALSI